MISASIKKISMDKQTVNEIIDVAVSFRWMCRAFHEIKTFMT